MPEPVPFRRLTFRIVLLKVSPLVARLVSVPDDLSLEELHEVLQLTFGWRCEPFYTPENDSDEILIQVLMFGSSSPAGRHYSTRLGLRWLPNERQWFR